MGPYVVWQLVLRAKGEALASRLDVCMLADTCLLLLPFLPCPVVAIVQSFLIPVLAWLCCSVNLSACLPESTCPLRAGGSSKVPVKLLSTVRSQRSACQPTALLCQAPSLATIRSGPGAALDACLPGGQTADDLCGGTVSPSPKITASDPRSLHA